MTSLGFDCTSSHHEIAPEELSQAEIMSSSNSSTISGLIDEIESRTGEDTEAQSLLEYPGTDDEHGASVIVHNDAGNYQGSKSGYDYSFF